MHQVSRLKLRALSRLLQTIWMSPSYTPHRTTSTYCMTGLLASDISLPKLLIRYALSLDKNDFCFYEEHVPDKVNDSFPELALMASFSGLASSSSVRSRPICRPAKIKLIHAVVFVLWT